MRNDEIICTSSLQYVIDVLEEIRIIYVVLQKLYRFLWMPYIFNMWHFYFFHFYFSLFSHSYEIICTIDIEYAIDVLEEIMIIYEVL